ncbi:hypothetical protein [Aquibium microcysteis]|uniref:hypothetical protein n=1 Tax=Aquibium microcysteis TaxID=675281 RepID=UPI00165D02D8|nr:hypothetical protein [Aquibium microcysteis]
MSYRDWSAGWRHSRMCGAALVGTGVMVRRLRLDTGQVRPAHVRIAAIGVSLLIWILLIGLVVWIW